jgi:hypothetical protein
MDSPEPLSYVQDRITILRAAHRVLTDLNVDFDVNELLDAAGWLAGDDVPGDPHGLLSDASEERISEEDGQGA